ncbi:MAG: GntR family transcriptional regulator [Solirubrobacteraceae bacterium]
MATNANIARDAIANALRDEIISGRRKPGERLIEKVVAERHGVSRVPVREALRRLESEGFVTLTPYQGAAVSETLRRDTVELMQVRRGLEVLAARLAAARRGGEVADHLTAVVARGEEAGRAQRIGELPALIMQFHELVAEASGNRQLKLMLDQVLQRISWGFELEIAQRIDSSWLDHSMIATAIINGSSLQAALLMDEHIVKDELLYRERFERVDE